MKPGGSERYEVWNDIPARQLEQSELCPATTGSEPVMRQFFITD
ncbi:hypothetical protein [Aestuariibacter sp. A3R04]|nr:hypothetical protein [Aestuariibacter sp. A3R04]